MTTENDTEGAIGREFGLRRALANMPRHSPGRAVIEALLARGTLTAEEARRFKAEGLRTALQNMPPDSPGRTVVEALLARESREHTGQEPVEAIEADALTSPEAASAHPGRVDLVDQLQRLGDLRERGHLTDSEFEAAKRKLMS
jgi:Short C-terminal domain